VLFFWASWSSPCKHMQAVLAALAQRHVGAGIAFLQASSDVCCSADRAVCMQAQGGAPRPVGCDARGSRPATPPCCCHTRKRTGGGGGGGRRDGALQRDHGAHVCVHQGATRLLAAAACHQAEGCAVAAANPHSRGRLLHTPAGRQGGEPVGGRRRARPDRPGGAARGRRSRRRRSQRRLSSSSTPSTSSARSGARCGGSHQAAAGVCPRSAVHEGQRRGALLRVQPQGGGRAARRGGAGLQGRQHIRG
jgi:hypothetical protein